MHFLSKNFLFSSLKCNFCKAIYQKLSQITKIRKEWITYSNNSSNYFNPNNSANNNSNNNNNNNNNRASNRANNNNNVNNNSSFKIVYKLFSRRIVSIFSKINNRLILTKF
jgi:hypothetical protein